MFAAWWRRLWGRDVSLGRRGEEAAAAYLERLGFRILHRAHRSRYGELDLIAVDGDVIVFIEVKTRRSADRGSPSLAVDRRKQTRMTRAALAYLKRHRMLDRRCRFDVVAVVWPEGGEPEIRHYRAAFEARGAGGMFC